MPTTTHDADWTALDDLHVMQQWANDPMKPLEMQRRSNTLMPLLWRYVPRFYGMFLEEILGPTFDLAIDTSKNAIVNVGGQQRHHPYPSEEFCQKMMQLLTHHMWLEQPGAVAVCLQYVVKCRTNDQRVMTWPRRNYTSDKFFDVYQGVTRSSQDGGLTVAEIHDEVVARMAGIPSPYSRLFRTIERLTFSPSTPAIHEPLSSGSVGVIRRGNPLCQGWRDAKRAGISAAIVGPLYINRGFSPPSNGSREVGGQRGLRGL